MFKNKALSFISFFSILISITMTACCKQKDTPEMEQARWVSSVTRSKDLNEAVSISKTRSKQPASNKHSLTHLTLALWGESHIDKFKFEQTFVAENETSFAKIQKNQEKEVGKKLCVYGRIVQISENGNLSDGLLITSDGIISFSAVGGSGDLTERSSAKICGVSTGLYTYENSGGGITHAISIVGVWDLPENKSSQPALTQTL